MISKISINSSSKSSTSSAFKVGEIIEKWGKTTIGACILGISKINIASDFYNKVSHSALLLLDRGLDEENDEEIHNELGILIEYGDYKPNMCDGEKNYVDKGFVVYRYEDKGGLRYYGKKYGEFIEEFGSIGYVDLNIHVDKQMTFNTFLDKIAKLEDNKWINEKYKAVSITSSLNCQDFTIEALNTLKPNFTKENIFPNSIEFARKKTYLKRLDFVPPNIKAVLLKYYVK